MSQENVEVVRRMLQAFAEGGLDAMAEFADPDINWRAAEGAIDDVGEMHGRVAVRGYLQDWIDTFDDFSVVDPPHDGREGDGLRRLTAGDVGLRSASVLWVHEQVEDP